MTRFGNTLLGVPAPLLHQLAPPLEHVASGVGARHTVAEGMGEGGLGNGPGRRGLLKRLVSETGAHPVRYGV